jgi:4-hydroxybenzoate polyprenyltransferase
MSKRTRIQKLNAYVRLMRLDKPVGILLLMWPTLWGLLLASQGDPDWRIVLIFVAGVILMRSAGCVMNDVADRHYDGHVERTKNRPLVNGEVSVKEAILLVVGLCLVALSLVCMLNQQTVLLSIVALFLAATYPLTKRFLVIPQAYLGIAFGFSIPMAFSAVSNEVPALAWWLLLANMFWAIAYDTEYAMVDRDDDAKIGLQSSALLFGRYDVLAIMLCYAAMLTIFIYVGKLMDFGLYYFAVLLLVLGLVVWQYQQIKRRDKKRCFAAFTSNNWIGLALLIALAFAYYLP